MRPWPAKSPMPAPTRRMSRPTDVQSARFSSMHRLPAPNILRFMTTHDPKSTSRAITEGFDRAPARAMLRAIGFSGEDLARPIIGVANTWTETMPCNFHLRRLAEHVKEGIRAAGATPMEFNTIAISDGVTMGTEGMKASLVSRELLAASIELVARGPLFHG